MTDEVRKRERLVARHPVLEVEMYGDMARLTADEKYIGVIRRDQLDAWYDVDGDQ